MDFKGKVIERKRLSTTILEPIGDIFGFGPVRIYFATINRAIAQRLIDAKNGQNRGLIATNVDRLTQAMANGHWRLMHQGIAFDSMGVVIDGQHRLHAVVASDTEHVFLVSEGWDGLVRPVTDHNIPRHLRDDLRIMGGVKSPDLVPVVLRCIQHFTNGTNAKISYETAIERVAVYRAGFAWAGKQRVGGRGRGTLMGPIVAAFVYAYPKACEIIPKAWNDLQAGENLSGKDAIKWLRDEALKEGVARKEGERLDLFRKTLNAIYHRANQYQCKQLKVSETADAFFREAYE